MSITNTRSGASTVNFLFSLLGESIDGRPLIERGDLYPCTTLREQFELSAHGDEALAEVADAQSVVVAEVGDGLEVGSDPAGQPHQFSTALSFTLQSSA